MAAGGVESELSDKDLVKISRITLQYLEKDPSRYKTDGLLRIADADATLTALIKALNKVKDNPKGVNKQIDTTKIGANALNPHSYVGALKRCILKSGKAALVSQHPSWEAMRTAIKNTDFDNPEQVEECVKTFNFALDKLANSPNEQDKNAAEVMYSLLHIATKISAQSEFNRMKPENCAIVVGPSMGELLSPAQVATNPMEMLALMEGPKKLAEALIRSNNYALPFKEASEFLGLTPEQSAQALAANSKMMEVTTQKFRTEMSKGAEADQALISRYNVTLQELSKRGRILQQLAGPTSASSSSTVAHPSATSISRTYPSFQSLDSSEKTAFLEKLIKIQGKGKDEKLQDILSTQSPEDLEAIQTHIEIEGKSGTYKHHGLGEPVWNAYQAQVRPSSSSSSSSSERRPPHVGASFQDSAGTPKRTRPVTPPDQPSSQPSPKRPGKSGGGG